MWKNKRAKHNYSSTGFSFTLFLPSFNSSFAVPVTVNRHLPINQFSDKLRKSIESEDGSGGLLVETGFRPNCDNEVFQFTLHLLPVKPAYQSPLLQLQI